MRRSIIIPLNLSALGTFGLSRFAASRALRQMERAGLVSSQRNPGCSPRITILELPESIVGQTKGQKPSVQKFREQKKNSEWRKARDVWNQKPSCR
jgi:hypothetical protein